MHLPIGSLEELPRGTSIYSVVRWEWQGQIHDDASFQRPPLWLCQQGYVLTPGYKWGVGDGEGPSYLLPDVGLHISGVVGGGGVIVCHSGGYGSFKPCLETVLQKQHSLFISFLAEEKAILSHSSKCRLEGRCCLAPKKFGRR